MADDLGHAGLNCYRNGDNGWLETPRLDGLASEGMRFNNGLAAYPTCMPARTALLSGQYGPRTGGYRTSDPHRGKEDLIRWMVPERTGLALEKITIAEQFKKAGYATAMYGKWHVGAHPSKQGFDTAYESTKHYPVGGPSGDKYPTPEGHGFKCDPHVDLPDGMHAAQLFTNMASDWLAGQAAAKQPFFLYMPYYLVHAPFESLPEYEEYFFRKLEKVKLKDPKKADAYGRMATPLVAAQTKLLDDCVGQLLDQLDALGIADNTIVVFTSDNGSYSIDYTGYNRGTKGDTYEGGLKVPYIFKWPGHIEPGTARDDRIIHIDLYPTLLSMAGVGLPDPATHPLDGVDLTPLLLDPSVTLPERDVFCFYPKYARYNKRSHRWYHSWRNVIYRGDYKLIEYPEYDEVELFNLENDPVEAENLLHTQSELAGQMRARLHAWMQAIDAPPLVPNPGYAGP